MANDFILEIEELRLVTAYASECAEVSLWIFEDAHPLDLRPREAVEAARAFALGGRRTKAIRDVAWAAMRAAQESTDPAASRAAKAAMCAASSAYLHPLAKATQVVHILGAAAYSAWAFELAAGDEPDLSSMQVKLASDRANLTVRDVLSRYPPAPAGGGRVGELLRQLDCELRGGAKMIP
jgi:hypothetical protein